MKSDEWIPCIVASLPESPSLSRLQTHNIQIACQLEPHRFNDQFAS